MLGGTYRILSRRGEGGMGVVFEAEHVRLDRRVAVKVLRPEFLRDADAVGRFCREARTAGRIRHDGIVEILDVNSEPGGAWYIVMELLQGEDLASLLARAGPLPVERAVAIARQVCGGLAVAHDNGIIHRDIKPANVFLADRGDGLDHVKLLDFGISKLATGGTTVTGTGQVVGTPLYMSPEQACGDPSLDHRTDIFAVGTALYEMLTGHAPFEAPSAMAVLARLMTQDAERPSRLNPNIPPWLERVVLRCLARDPDGRFNSSRELAEVLAAGPDGKEPPAVRAARSIHPEELRVVTVLFATFSPTATGDCPVPPDEASRLIEAPLCRTDEIVRRHGGTVLRRFADGIMAVFGAPSARGDDAACAVRAALEMRDNCGCRCRADGRHDVALRAGLATGRVVAGQMRAGEETGYGVVGQAVTLARRLEGLGAEGSVLLCAETQVQVRGRFRIRAIESTSAPPGEARLPAYEVLDEHPHGLVVPPREVLGARPPMVGRDVEIAQLKALLDRVTGDSSPQAVTVIGAPGIGKSRLAHELRCHVEALDHDVLTLVGRADENASGTPLSLWASAIRAKSGVLAGEDQPSSVRKLREFGRFMLGQESDPSAEAVDTLALLLGLRSAEPGADALRGRVFTVLVEFLRGITRRMPLLLVLEDVHWADRPSLELLELLLDRLADRSVFVLLLGRPEFLDVAPGLLASKDFHLRLDLRAISRRAGMALVKHVLGGDVPEDVLGRVVARAEGTPLFIEEILHVLAEDGALSRDGKSWRAVRKVDSVDIPLTVEAVLQARLDILPPVERDVLQKAAVVGESFWDGTLSVLGADAPEASLVRLCTREFLRLQPSSRFSGFREYAFRHALVRDVAYSMTPGSRRREMHAAVAEWIESREGGSIEDNVLAARHFEVAGAGDRAARAFIRAGRRAAKDYNAFEEARRYLQAALDLADALGDEVLRRDAMGHIGQVYARNAQHIEAEQFLRRAIDLAVGSGDEKAEADFSLALGHTLAAGGDRDAARALLGRARAIVGSTGDPVAMAEFHKDEGLIEFMLKDWNAAVAATERAIAIGAAHDLHYLAAVCAHNIGDVLLREGKLDEAQGRLTESLRIADGHSFDKMQHLNRAFLACIDVLRSRTDRGVAEMLRSIAYAEKKQWIWDQIQEKQLLAFAYRALGRPLDAIAQLEDVLALSRASGNTVYTKECQEMIAELRSAEPGPRAPS